MHELIVIDGGSKVPPRPRSERSEAAQLFHSSLTVRRTQEELFRLGPSLREVAGRRYAIVLRDWKPCQA